MLLTNGENPVVKISDFGLAKMVDNMTFLRTACGTPTYLAPEVVLNQDAYSGYSFAVDAWSIGVIVYAILANSTPFEEGLFCHTQSLSYVWSVLSLLILQMRLSLCPREWQSASLTWWRWMKSAFREQVGFRSLDSPLMKASL